MTDERRAILERFLDHEQDVYSESEQDALRAHIREQEAEIERLQDWKRRASEELYTVQGQLAAGAAEIERLREAILEAAK